MWKTFRFNSQKNRQITELYCWLEFFFWHRGMYPYVIFVLVSNKDPEYINNLDKCYIRKGRVDMIFELRDNISYLV